MAGCVARSPVAPVKFDLAIIRFSVSQNLGYLKIIQVSGHSSQFWGINSFSQPPQSFFYFGFHENWDNPQFSPMVIHHISIIYSFHHGESPWPFSVAHWERHRVVSWGTRQCTNGHRLHRRRSHPPRCCSLGRASPQGMLMGWL